MVVHVLTIGLTASILYLAVPGSDLFSWHPSLMTAAFALLMAQAIVIFSPESSLLLNSNRGDKIQLHWILNLFSVLGAAGGFGAIYLNKEIAVKPHFTTWHSKFGLASLVGMIVVALGGIAAKYSSNFRQWVKPINIKLYHATLALIVFCLAMTTISLSCYSNWVRKRVEGYLWRCLFWSPIILAVCIARQVTQSYLPRVAQPSPPQPETKTRKKSKEDANKEK